MLLKITIFEFLSFRILQLCINIDVCDRTGLVVFYLHWPGNGIANIQRSLAKMSPLVFQGEAACNQDDKYYSASEGIMELVEQCKN